MERLQAIHEVISKVQEIARAGNRLQEHMSFDHEGRGTTPYMSSISQLGREVVEITNIALRFIEPESTGLINSERRTNHHRVGDF